VDNPTVFKQRLDEVGADLAAGRHAKALEGAKQLVASYPDAARAHNMYGILRAGANDGEGALASFRAATDLDPGFGEAHYNLGLALCQQQNYSVATESLRRALELNPKIAAYYVVFGNALRQQGKHDEAIAAYEQSLKVGGVSESLIRNNIGAVHLDLNLPEKAAQAFRRAADLQPDSGAAHLNLGRALSRLGRTGEALESFKTAARLDPKSADAALLLANTLRDVGKFEEAVAAYKTVLQLRPDDKQAGYHLGLVLLELGRNADGLRAIADGPGMVRISGGPPASGKGRSAVHRVDIGISDTPTFIGCWKLANAEVCDRLIAFFEANSDRHASGRTGVGIDKAAKNSTDLTVLPCDLKKSGFEAVTAYLAHLEDCYRDYALQWPFLGSMLPQGEIMPFTIQRYGAGGHFQRVHSERTSGGFAHRVLAWMTYLDDVADGGETRFHHYGIAVRPERGKTLIWPAEWTHAHSGGVVSKGFKHIITGWIHFPLTSNVTPGT
jgi:tetratricopeptide (TPR) repeat protein